MGALAAYGGDFGATLGSCWGQFGVSLGSVWVSVGDFASLDGHFAIIVESPWVYKRSVSEKHLFSIQISMIL